jgi:hypothetical protein
MLTIYTNGNINIDGRETGLTVTQHALGTLVHRTQPVMLPHQRYSLACDAPASGAPGRAQFEADLLAAIDKLDAELLSALELSA